MTVLLNNPASGGKGYTCQKCGGPMPELSDELVALARRAGGVTLAHDVCPGDLAAAETAGRAFELRSTIVEIVPDEAEPGGVRVEEMMRFDVGVRAENLDAAMRPMALAFGEKWERAEKNAGIADTNDHPGGN